ncbi:hypothetical protein ACF0H5_017247 [Mactra antiquata]
MPLIIRKTFGNDFKDINIYIYDMSGLQSQGMVNDQVQGFMVPHQNDHYGYSKILVGFHIVNMQVDDGKASLSRLANKRNGKKPVSFEVKRSQFFYKNDLILQNCE